MSYFMKTGILLPISALLCLVGSTGQMQAQNRDGAAVFQTVCSNCHKEGSPMNAPLPDVLRKHAGPGDSHGAGIGKNAGHRRGVERRRAGGRGQISGCRGRGIHPAVRALFRQCLRSRRMRPSWNGWGIDPTNSRFQNAKAAGLTAADVPKLKLKWAFGYPGVTTSFGTPTVFGGRVFVGAADGSVFSLNAQSGCIYWIYKATEGVRTGPVISSDGKIAYISDLHAWVHAVNAETGAVIWKDHMDEEARRIHSGNAETGWGPPLRPGFRRRGVDRRGGSQVPLLQNAREHGGPRRKDRQMALEKLHDLRTRENDRQDQHRSRDLGTVRSKSLDFSHHRFKAPRHLCRHRNQLFAAGHKDQRLGDRF